VTVSTRLPTLAAERVRRRRWSRLRTMLLVLGLAALGAFAGWVFLGSGVFGVSSVTVTGTSRVSVAQVVDLAAIRSGTPLARVDTAAAAERVARLPAVRAVDVHRDWPRTVRIVVHERVPAAVRARGTGFVLVDRTGVAFDAVERRPDGLPLVSAPVDAGPPALKAALDVLEAVPDDVRAAVRSVRAADVDDVTLRLTRGRVVVWGSTERSERKGAVLAVLMTRKHADVIDVSTPDAPVTRRN
jgi:cell division protein FtsQ